MKLFNFLIENISVVFLGMSLLALAAGPKVLAAETEKAIFAGGCFWCMEKPFEKVDGVFTVTSGYIGGRSDDPTYETYGADGHLEAVEVVYDPGKVDYQTLLDIFWRQIDPTDGGGGSLWIGDMLIVRRYFILMRSRSG